MKYAIQVKMNILRFSGYVWQESDEKQKLKVKEKLDKNNKEKLLEFFDLFDMPIGKTSAKKEDVVIKLIDFMLKPHVTNKSTSAMMHHAGHRFHEVFQMKHGDYSDLPAAKISELMKSNSLDVISLMLFVPCEFINIHILQLYKFRIFYCPDCPYIVASKHSKWDSRKKHQQDE
ncbi:unnamed protein product [Lactuca saligna]|uniref:Uncharacterized protein n=1 Tax=Lactuca saligna TaxID=75948 RepID=A0AA35UPF9_LACSI|nr:unnamed protein product [Lactuca saligna]